MMQEISANGKKILRLLTQQAMEGYSLMSRTGLKQDELQTAVDELLNRSLISIKGAPSGDELGKAYLWVPPNVQGRAEYLLGELER
jgi:hypothetical protein